MRKGKGLALAIAISVPVLIMGGGLAMASDDVPCLLLDCGSTACADECQTNCTAECDQPPSSILVCTQSVTPSSEILCVGIGCWDPRMQPVGDTENGGSHDSDSAAPDEAPCVSCDVVLLNEYPEYRYRD
ncbi:hypothetical protein ACFLUT_00400 [Chloroflexota bacterium]